jgi:hypothetical protein
MKRYSQQGLALFLSWCLLLIGAGNGFGGEADALNSQPLPQAAQQSPEQLQQLVAPIALYPDAMVAQILAAATYPDQVVQAGNWMQQHKDLQGEQLASQVDTQPWDPSVKALVQFPAVLANMNQNLAWTSEVGDAHLNQQQELAQAIQVMRERARQAGNLNTTAQEKVGTKDKNIVIQPAVTNEVYVPQYDPWLVYGDPLAAFPGWYPYPGLFLDGPGVDFGLGFGVGLFAGFGWGWPNWGYDWRHGGRVVYNRNPWISHSTTIVNRNNFRTGGTGFSHGIDSSNRSFGRGAASTRAGAFSGFSQGGVARGNAFRGQSSSGGFRGGGFGGGGFGGGGFHGGGRR